MSTVLADRRQKAVNRARLLNLNLETLSGNGALCASCAGLYPELPINQTLNGLSTGTCYNCGLRP